MRRIDLICKLLGPLSISIIAGVSNKTAIAVTFGVNLASVVSEYACIAKVRFGISAFQHPNLQTTGIQCRRCSKADGLPDQRSGGAPTCGITPKSLCSRRRTRFLLRRLL